MSTLNSIPSKKILHIKDKDVFGQSWDNSSPAHVTYNYVHKKKKKITFTREYIEALFFVVKNLK